MREISIQQRTSGNHKRKNLCIVEMINQKGLVARAEKKFSYYVSQQNPFKDTAEMKEWMDVQAGGIHHKERHVSIKKVLDNKTGAGQMIYRVIGSFYVVQDLKVYAVVFMHSIKFDMLSNRLPDTIHELLPEEPRTPLF